MRLRFSDNCGGGRRGASGGKGSWGMRSAMLLRCVLKMREGLSRGLRLSPALWIEEVVVAEEPEERRKSGRMRVLISPIRWGLGMETTGANCVADALSINRRSHAEVA